MRGHESWDCTDKQDYCRHRRLWTTWPEKNLPATGHSGDSIGPSEAGKHSETDAVEE